ncbi:fluoride efflux transporter CrcB [Aneurinibacillus migulanus]|uniref:Fluoride-specific ion channel FluC n=2 Tax=Aneurinibacillus migulanus TaxID=47500 RepID=A0A1G8UUM7_ANEMI|nr:fluoride efflux transporter CrcB [Aneurinibacillus migulanus]MED0895229.1 fluoride efflux transporter CrcB [Aneurinibacillus migulanus]SDJ57508.1 CrcB protein [Aneurinibacillus migulanus]
MMEVLWVALGGFFGAISRFTMVGVIDKQTNSSFPYGTLTVNVLGSFCLGLLYGLDVGWQVKAMLGAGFLGSFTTFSTFAYENVQLQRLGKRKEARLYIGISVLAGIAAVALGFWIGRMI